VKRFIRRALEKFSKMDRAQIRTLLQQVAGENEMLEIVLDSLTDGVMVSDTNHTVLFFNKSAERLLRIQGTDLYEQKIWEIVSDFDISEFVRVSLVDQERIQDKEFTIEREGVNRILSISVLPLVNDGTIQGNILHIEDVTEKRNRDARLRRAESLAALTTLTAGVAHEIKNPLGSLSIHIQLIQRALKGKEKVDSNLISSYLEVMNEEVERLNNIVVDFLFAVRPMNAELEESNLHSIINDLLDFLKYELQEAHIKVNQQLTDALPMVLLDERYIKQALLNIIKNSIAAMERGGTITIKTRYEGDFLRLCIADNGTGISDEVIEKIFEPYYTTKDSGSGLGLTLVYKIIKEHNAEIEVNSTEGEGTAFSIRFPVPQKERKLLDWKGDSE